MGVIKYDSDRCMIADEAKCDIPGYSLQRYIICLTLWKNYAISLEISHLGTYIVILAPLIKIMTKGLF